MANENVLPQDNHETLKVSTSSDPHHSPKMLLIALAAFLIIIIGGGIGYFLGTNNIQQITPEVTNQTVKLSPTPTPDSTADWKTYTNTENGFSFKYPHLWRIIEEPKKPIELNDEFGNLYLSISFANPALIGISFCGAYPEDKRCEILKVGDISFNIDWDVDGKSTATTEIKGVAMFITLHQTTTPAKKNFRQILSTFKFTNQNQSNLDNNKSCNQDNECSLLVCGGCFNKEWLKSAPPDLGCMTYEEYSCKCINNRCSEVK